MPNSSDLPDVQVCRDRKTLAMSFPRSMAMSATSTKKNWGVFLLTTEYEGFSHQQRLHQCGFVLPLDQQEQEENKEHCRVSAPMLKFHTRLPHSCTQLNFRNSMVQTVQTNVAGESPDFMVNVGEYFPIRI